MSGTAHPSRDDLVAYALGALDPPEAEAVSGHAPGCEPCTRELRAVAPAVAVLGESVEQLEPPAELRDRVLSVVRAEAGEGEVAKASSEHRAKLRERFGLRGMLLRPAMGLAAVAAVAAGAAGYLVAKDDGGGSEQTTVALVRGGRGMAGTMRVGDDSTTLELQGMRRLTGSQIYQVWLGQGKALRPSSTFKPGPNGHATVAIDEQLGPGTQLMVTREPRAGDSLPTPPVLLSTTVQ